MAEGAGQDLIPADAPLEDWEGGPGRSLDTGSQDGGEAGGGRMGSVRVLGDLCAG